jgi:hypothetical protein
VLLSTWVNLAAATSAAAAAVPTGTTASVNELEAPHRLRSGVVVGVALGAGIVGASGYPNEAIKIGDPAYYSASGWMLGSSESFFLMGALTDYLSFGFWYAHAASSNRHWESNGNGGGLRVEAFPLIGVFPRLAGLGLVGQFGLGSGDLSSKTPGFPNSEGTQSFIGAGAFYEWSFGHFIGGHFGAGPDLQYDAIWSLPFERHGLVAAVRLAFYGGPS